MSKFYKLEIETIIFIILVALSTVLFVMFSNKNFIIQFRTPPVVTQAKSEKIAPIVQSALPNIETAFQISPDGTSELKLKIEHHTDTIDSYTLSAINKLTSGEKILYTYVSTQSAEKAAIPFNAWSPDDKYVFINKNNHAFVFQASGEHFTSEDLFLDATNIFGQKITENNFGEATGWASPTLLIINSVAKDGSKGPSYWFEVPSEAIIQLSTQF